MINYYKEPEYYEKGYWLPKIDRPLKSKIKKFIENYGAGCLMVLMGGSILWGLGYLLGHIK